jgi:tyrosyl-tRNA synthetase
LNEAKKILATEATALLHGREAADRAEATARTTFEQGMIAETLPTFELPRAELEKGWGVLSANMHVGFVASTSEARRQIKGGGLKVNDEPVTDERRLLTLADLTPEGVIKLSLGKKRHALIRPV